MIDDGSTDSVDILMQYVHDNRNLRYVRQTNSRQSAARNHGLRIAQGDYVFFCDSDDFVVPNVFKQLLEIADKESVDVLCYKCVIVQNIHHDIEPSVNWDSVKSYSCGIDYINAPSNPLFRGPYCFWARRKFLLEKQVLFDETMLMREDMKHFSNMILKSGKVAIVDSQVYCYVQNEESVVHMIGKKQNSIKYVDDILEFIRYCKSLQPQILADPMFCEGVVDKITNRINEDSFIVLHNTMRFADMSRNYNVVKWLKDAHVYPIRGGRKYKILYWLMNKPALWLCFCFLYHLLPRSLKVK